MSRAWAIAAREYASFFRIPLGWVVAALFLFICGYVFSRYQLVEGAPASMRTFFSASWELLLIVAPAMSMRLLADETRSGAIESLMTAPLTEAGVVLGKFLGAFLFLATCLAPTLVYVVILNLLARPDLGPIAAGYLGILLTGMLYLGVGTLFSTVTSSQTLAFLLTLFTLAAVEFGSERLSVALAAYPLWADAAAGLSISSRTADFAAGVVDTAHIVFFLAVTAWTLGLSALILRIRRWR